MKKITMLALAVVFAAGTTTMKAQSFGEGAVLVSAGYGFGNFTQALFSTLQNNAGYKYSSLGPVFVKGEYGVSEHIGFGVNIAYMGVSVSDDFPGFDANLNPITYNEKYSYTTYSVLARMNLHFATSDKLDPFWGIGVGYRGASWKYTTTDPLITTGGLSTSGGFPLGFETTLGLRYYPVEHLGIYVEAGIAKGFVQLGLTYKI